MQYKLITRNVEVIARPKYMSKESSPRENLFIWVYDIRLENRSQDTVQLLRRHWVITEGEAHIKQVEGPGVVGLQPVLRPMEVFEYSSFCTLTRSFGFMEGRFEMVNQKGEYFFIEIPKFPLKYPVSLAFTAEPTAG